MKLVRLCQIDGCLNPYYGNQFCKKHYKQDYWKSNKEFRERSNNHNKENWKKFYYSRYKKGKDKYRKVYSSIPEKREMHRIATLNWGCNNRKRMNDTRKIWRKTYPEKGILENRKGDLRILKAIKKFSWSVKHLRFSLYNWAKIVKKRDKQQCQICGSKDNLITHHIFPKAEYPQLCLNVNNGVTLCRDHHLETHGLKVKQYPS